MNKMKLVLLIVLVAVFAFLIYQKPRTSQDTVTIVDSLSRRIVELEEDVEYLSARERQFLDESGTAKERVAELEFILSKRQPTTVQIVKPTNTNEKIVPISTTASEYYNDILSKRYENY